MSFGPICWWRTNPILRYQYYPRFCSPSLSLHSSSWLSGAVSLKKLSGAIPLTQIEDNIRDGFVQRNTHDADACSKKSRLEQKEHSSKLIGCSVSICLCCFGV